MPEEQWYIDEESSADAEGDIITEFDIVSSPNDFNIKTMYDFIDSGVVDIPPFQRNYVWDIKRASRLIESLVMGLPIPQIFLYEQAKNNFLVIDGQQRLLTIFYFLKKRFPKQDKRAQLRRIQASSAATPDDLLHDDNYFEDFQLSLPSDVGQRQSPLHGLTYDSLGERKTSFDLRTIRNIIVKQANPEGIESIYEIFNRLNSGGINLTSQEIRMSLYHSAFAMMINKANFDGRWRELLGRPNPDLHSKDVEFLLRGFALLINYPKYKPPMAKFLTRFCKQAMLFDHKQVAYLELLLYSFFDCFENLSETAFHGQTSKFTISIFDAVFAAVCERPFRTSSLVEGRISEVQLDRMKNDPRFHEATQSRTTGSGNVRYRIEIAKQFLNV